MQNYLRERAISEGSVFFESNLSPTIDFEFTIKGAWIKEREDETDKKRKREERREKREERREKKKEKRKKKKKRKKKEKKRKKKNKLLVDLFEDDFLFD